jgi:hypothetical protein
VSPALVFAALLFALALSSAVQLVRTRRRRRLIERTPTTPASQVQEGHVEVQGRIVPLGTVRAPVTGKDVVHLRVEIQEERRPDHFVTVREEERRLPFLLEDASGRVRVVPEKAELLYARDAFSEPVRLPDASDEVRALVLRTGLDPDATGNHRVRVALTYLEPGDELWVCGAAHAGQGGIPVIAGGVSRELPFLISDHREALVLDRLRRQERASLLGAASLSVLAAIFLVVALA